MTLLEVLRCTVHPDVSPEARLGPRAWHHQRAVLALESRSGSLLGHRLLLVSTPAGPWATAAVGQGPPLRPRAPCPPCPLRSDVTGRRPARSALPSREFVLPPAEPRAQSPTHRCQSPGHRRGAAAGHALPPPPASRGRGAGHGGRASQPATRRRVQGDSCASAECPS